MVCSQFSQAFLSPKDKKYIPVLYIFKKRFLEIYIFFLSQRSKGKYSYIKYFKIFQSIKNLAKTLFHRRPFIKTFKKQNLKKINIFFTLKKFARGEDKIKKLDNNIFELIYIVSLSGIPVLCSSWIKISPHPTVKAGPVPYMATRQAVVNPPPHPIGRACVVKTDTTQPVGRMQKQVVRTGAPT